MSNACKIEELSQLKIKESPTLMDYKLKRKGKNMKMKY